MFLAILRRFPAGVGPWIDTVLTVGAFAVFVMLWAGFAYSFVADPTLPGHAWTWLSGLDDLPRILVWIGILPIAVGLWAWVSSFPLPVAALLGTGIVAWSLASALRVIGLVSSRR